MKLFLTNLLGWFTSKKIVVFESDDWGSTRMPNKETRDLFENAGFPVSTNYFTRLDTLESKQDLQQLKYVLSSFQDKDGRSPVFTMLNVMGNPDYQKIKLSNFEKYYWLPFPETYRLYGIDPIAMKAEWEDGLRRKIFFSSFHGREHVHISRWMEGLRKTLPCTTMAFNYGLSGIHAHLANEKRKDYQAAFDADSIEDFIFLNNAIIQGLNFFETYFGYKASFMVPPNGLIPNQLFTTLKNSGIRYVNTTKLGLSPLGNGKYKRHLRYLGKLSKDGMVFLTRNASFEPANTRSNFNWVDKCMAEIAMAFRLGKPAVIATHRVNYVGGIEEKNREGNLKELQKLIQFILMKFPDVQFLNSDELGKLIEADRH